MSISDLNQFRDSKTPSAKVWRLEPLKPVLGVTILAIDQSLGNAGWAVISPDGTVGECGNIKTADDSSGHEGTLRKGTEQFLGFLHLMRQVNPGMVVHEMPPISRPGMKMMRPESSLVSACALRCAAEVIGIDVRMYGAQKAKKRFTGNGNADKSLVREAIHRLDPSLTGRRPLNEHIRDAIAVGWLGIEEER